MTSSENRASSAETAQPKERGRRAQVSSEDRVRKELAFRACVIRITLAVGQDEIEAPLPLVEQFQTTGFDARTLNFEQRIELPVLPKVCWSGSEGVRHFSTD
jgi:hypothetical protein